MCKHMSMALVLPIVVLLLSYAVWKVLYCCWILPNFAYTKLRRNGFGGPPPRFPFGNITDIFLLKDQITTSSSSSSSTIHHNIHSMVFPHFSQWQKSHGKVFVYWLGTEPFLYVSDPEFLKEMSERVMSRRWGKPSVFKSDREPMFGNGLTMVEGDDWVRHRHAIAPSFSSSNLEAMASLMVESTNKMVDRWSHLVSSGKPEIEAEEELSIVTGDMIAKASLSISYNNQRKIFEKIRALQFTIFSSNRYVGVPFGKFMSTKRTIEAKRLGKDIDSLILSSIQAQKGSGETSRTLVASLLAQQNEGDNRKRKLSLSELVNECKTIIFGGFDTTASTLAWSLLLLAMHPEWQTQLRNEVKAVVGDKHIDGTMLSELKKVPSSHHPGPQACQVHEWQPKNLTMDKSRTNLYVIGVQIGWVMNEVLRLYPSAPNAQRQAREDIRMHDKVIPKGTNVWIDITSMHHDPNIWGHDVNVFRPERFKDDPYGGAKYKMGFMPFGFGGRMCVGRNLAIMEYKICLSLILTRFSVTLSPNYCHSPTTLLTLRPTQGLPLILQPL